MYDPLDLETYDYYLPVELIAQQPLANRAESRLLHLDRASEDITHRTFKDIVGIIEPQDLLVVNTSKVIPARLFGSKENGTRVKILLLHQTGPSQWRCLASPGKRLRVAQILQFGEGLIGSLSVSDDQGIRDIEFHDPETYWGKIERIGHVPLPPYIKREDASEDKTRYQTVYASQPGSVAAPTAGLHFTPEILAELRSKGTRVSEVILHVGIGTFLPVKTPRIDQHLMHKEFCTLPETTALEIERTKIAGGRVFTVGSTTLRTLEHFWTAEGMRHGSEWTDIFLYPGKPIRVADALITNFHLPKSSLMMMISAFAGIDLVKRAYAEAVDRQYRFFSYGDAMLIT